MSCKNNRLWMPKVLMTQLTTHAYINLINVIRVTDLSKKNTSLILGLSKHRGLPAHVDGIF